MTGSDAAGTQENMPHIPSASSFSPNSSQQASELDYDVARQLIQHSQGGRLKINPTSQNSGQNENDSRFRRWDSVETSENVGPEDDQRQQTRSPSQTIVQKAGPDAQYMPMVNSPALGQVCR